VQLPVNSEGPQPTSVFPVPQAMITDHDPFLEPLTVSRIAAQRCRAGCRMRDARTRKAVRRRGHSTLKPVSEAASEEIAHRNAFYPVKRPACRWADRSVVAIKGGTRVWTTRLAQEQINVRLLDRVASLCRSLAWTLFEAVALSATRSIPASDAHALGQSEAIHS